MVLRSPIVVGPMTETAATNRHSAPMMTGPAMPWSTHPGPTSVPGPMTTSPSSEAEGWTVAVGSMRMPRNAAWAGELMGRVYARR